MNKNKINDLTQIAINASIKAGNLLTKKTKKPKNIHSSIGRDIKLEVDFESEKLITEYLIKNSIFPVLGEELGANKKLGNTFWVVDPLDGTANFYRNIPISCISIALVTDLDPIIGVIYDFNNKDLYVGSIKSSAQLNGKNIRVSNIKDKSQSILISGLPVNTDYSNKSMKKFIEDLKNWKKVRMLGSAAIAAAYVASGRADAYKESRTNLWDVAAGVAIVRAAGGKATIKDINKDYSLDISISNNFLE